MGLSCGRGLFTVSIVLGRLQLSLMKISKDNTQFMFKKY